MNKATQRQGIHVIFIHGVGNKTDHIIKDMKGKVLLKTRELTQVFMWVNQNKVNVVRVDHDYGGKPLKVETKSVRVRPIPVNETRQYAEHHEEARQHKKAVKKISAKFNIADEVAEKLLPFIDAIFPPISTGSDTNWNEINWNKLDEQSFLALEILSEAEWD
ncbi:MAG: hypothetical protein ACKPCP_32960 [Sphaerospermopsis kisseleviana]